MEIQFVKSDYNLKTFAREMANPKEQMNQSYIETKLGGIFEPMVASIVKDKPVDCVRLESDRGLGRFHA